MDSYKDLKLKIAAIVAEWEIANFPEYMQFLAARKAKTSNLRTKFGETDQKDGALERLLFEMPESLDGKLITALNDDELKFLRSKEGGLWFAKTFKQYTVPEQV